VTEPGKKEYTGWDCNKLADWLVSKNAVFAQYKDKLVENGVDGSLLGDLASDAESLKEIGITNDEHATALKRLHEELEAGGGGATQAITNGQGAPTPTSAKKGKAVPPTPPPLVETDEQMAARLKKMALQKARDEENWEIIKGDPNSQYVAAKTWEELQLKEGLLNSLYSVMKFQKPSKIQEHALPLGLAEPPANGIFQAKSGHGKTCAFSLIMLMRIDEKQAMTQAVCLAPTYELAIQIAEVCQAMGTGIGATVLTAVADDTCRFAKGSKCHSHIVIGTPGKVKSLLKLNVIDRTTVKMFVLDEADAMVGKGIVLLTLTKIVRGLIYFPNLERRPSC
jgi:hypothetical protein